MLLGRGSLNADIVFVGDAPRETYGGWEKRVVFGPYSPTGKKFGILLKKLIEDGESDVLYWLTNVVKCSCDENEIKTGMKNCREFLLREIEIVNPRLIVLFGKHVVETVLNEDFRYGTLSEVRTDEKRYRCLQLYHPTRKNVEQLEEMARKIGNSLP